MVSSDDVNLIEWAFKVVVGAILALGSWLWRGLVSDVRDIQKDNAAQKVYVEREFERKETIQYSLQRIHERLDDLVSLVGTRRD